MSATLKTENYDLPYFAESDDTDWTAYNDSVNKVDEVMKQNATEAGEAKTVAGEANSNATTAVEQVTELTEKVSTNTSNIADATNKVSGLQTTVENLETHMNDVDTEIETAKTDISNNTRNISAALNNIDTLSATVTQNKRDTDATLQTTNNTLNIVKERAQNNENNITALATQQQTMEGEIAKNEADIALLKKARLEPLENAVHSPIIGIQSNGTVIIDGISAEWTGKLILVQGTTRAGDVTPVPGAGKELKLNYTAVSEDSSFCTGNVSLKINGGAGTYIENFNVLLVVEEEGYANFRLMDEYGNYLGVTAPVQSLPTVQIRALGFEIPSASRKLIPNKLNNINVINAYDGYVDTDSVDKKDCVDGPPYPEEGTPVITKSKMLPEI